MHKQKGEVMTTAKKLDPIFVHASARACSSYFFNVLRRNEAFLCYSSAIIDGKRDVVDPARQSNIVWRRSDATFDINHHFLERPDYYEFIEAWDAVMHLCPECPTFQDYLPSGGVLSDDLRAFLAALIEHARSQGKRPVLCETNSRGRAGALRNAFGGFHIAQYRDPLSQFGSFIRAVIEGGFWGFLSHPATELGTCATHPLYAVVPPPWRVPNLPWTAGNRAQRWASDARYIAMVGAPERDMMEKVFRWHLFSWVLSNLAAIAYSDFALDMDKIHDDPTYRASVVSDLAAIGVVLDFSDLKKFDRYYEFESFDTETLCNQVSATIKNALGDGTLDQALRTLGRQFPITSAATGVEILLWKMSNSLAAMATSADRHHVSAAEWNAVVRKRRKIWFNPSMQILGERVYPFAAPIVHAGRRLGLWN